MSRRRLVLVAAVVGVFLAAVAAANPELRGPIFFLLVAATAAALLVVLLRMWPTLHKTMQSRRGSATPETAEEAILLDDLRQQLRQTLGTLRRGDRRRPGGRQGLYGKPWYLLLGPSGSGKSSSLATSEHASPLRRRMKAHEAEGDDSLRNRFVWQTPEAIFLDAPGILLTEEQASKDWLGLLDSLGKWRDERPLDAVLLYVDLPQLLGASEDARVHLATNLRQRLEEIHHRLEMVLPVIVVFSKLDGLEGFSEFWSHLPVDLRGQPWGAAFASDDTEQRKLPALLRKELETLWFSLHRRLPQRVAEGTSVSDRVSMMKFALAFANLRGPLTQFFDALVEGSDDDAKSIFRGFYFTSSLQSDTLRTPSRSYFFGDILGKVLLPDRGLGSHSFEGLIRRQRLDRMLSFACVFAAMAVWLPSILRYDQNLAVVAQAVQLRQKLRYAPSHLAAGEAGHPVEGALEVLADLNSNLEGLAPLRAAEDLQPFVEGAYALRIEDTLRQILAPSLLRQMSRDSESAALDDSVDTGEQRSPRRQAYDRLRIYALMSDPVGHLDADGWAATKLATLWKTELQRKSSPGIVAESRLIHHAQTFLRALGHPQLAALRWPDGPMLALRRTFRQAHREAKDLPYNWILRNAHGASPIVATGIFGGETLKYVSCTGPTLVEKAFTLEGWQRIRPMLDAPLPMDARVEPWVLADDTIPVDEEELRKQLRDRYFDDYTSAWLGLPGGGEKKPSFLEKCQVLKADASSPPTFARDRLVALKGPGGFYKKLFGQFKAHLVRDEPKFADALGTVAAGCASRIPGLASNVAPLTDGGTLSAPPHALDRAPVAQRFGPLLRFVDGPENKATQGERAPLDSYGDWLGKLADHLGKRDPNPQEAEAAFNAARTAINTMVDDSFSDPTRETVRRLLIAPVESSQSIHVEQSGRELGSDWKTTVWSFWHARLRDRWPFQRSADTDAEFQDFVQFFEPGKGILWGFVAKNLSNKIEWKGSRFVAKDDEESHLTSSAFGCLNAAKEITDAFFPPNGSPGLRFDVMGAWTQTDATEIKLLVGPKTAFPLTRDQWIHATWFGETDVHVSWVQPGFQKTEEGHRSFALFNLFRTVGGLSHLGSGVYGTPYAALGIKVRAASGVDAFAPNFFTKLSCPDTIHRSARERRTN